MVDALPENAAVEVGERVSQALGRVKSGCAEDLECVRRVGTALGVNKVVVLRLGKLGDTLLIRSSLIDVAQATQEKSRQEVLVHASEAHIEGAIARMADDLMAPYRSEGGAWYTQWWLWTIIGGVALGGSTLLFFPQNGPEPDVIVTPP
ncbi:MAG: hypothetical protein QF464_18030 [Myxococcota bacterium]|nr:hypothetical protein [Myxococcota bacterium]